MLINAPSGNELSAFYVVYKGSCHIEEKGQWGISHLMEHLVCKGFEPLLDQFDASAIEWNAYTSQNEIVFYISGLDEHVSRLKEPFLQGLFKFNITPEELEKEKNIVMAEYKQSFADTAQGHYMCLMRKYFDFFSPIGEASCIQNINLDQCNAFFQKQFSKPSQIINISKNSPFEMAVEFAPEIEMRKYVMNESAEYSPEDYPLVPGAESIVMFRDEVPEDKSFLNSFVSSLLCGGFTSPFYQIIREKYGLVYNMSLFPSYLGKQCFPVFLTMAPTQNVPAIVDAASEVITNIDEHLKFDDFLKFKSYLKNMFKIQDQYKHEDSELYINPDRQKLKANLQAINFDEVMEFTKEYYDMSKWNVSLGSDLVRKA